MTRQKELTDFTKNQLALNYYGSLSIVGVKLNNGIFTGGCNYKFQYKKCHILSNKYTQHLSVFMEDV